MSAKKSCRATRKLGLCLLNIANPRPPSCAVLRRLAHGLRRSTSAPATTAHSKARLAWLPLLLRRKCNRCDHIRQRGFIFFCVARCTPSHFVPGRLPHAARRTPHLPPHSPLPSALAQNRAKQETESWQSWQEPHEQEQEYRGSGDWAHLTYMHPGHPRLFDCTPSAIGPDILLPT